MPPDYVSKAGAKNRNVSCNYGDGGWEGRRRVVVLFSGDRGITR